MAENEVGSLKVSIGFDSKDFTKSLQELSNRLKVVRSEFDNFSESKGLDSLKSQTSEVTDELGKLESQTKRTNDAIKEQSKTSTNFGASLGGLKGKFGGITDKLKGLNGNLVVLGAKVGAVVALAPTLTVAMGAIGSSMASAGAGAIGFGAVAIGVLGDVFTASEELTKAQEDLTKATTAEEREKALLAQKEAMAGLSEEQRKSVESLQKFGSFWGDFTSKFEKPIGTAFRGSLDALKTMLELSKPMIDGVAQSVVGLVDDFNNSLGSSRVKDIFTWLGETAGNSISNFGKIFGNIFVGIMDLLKAFRPAGEDFEGGLLSMSEKFSEWASTIGENTTFKTFVEYIQTVAPIALRAFGTAFQVLFDIWGTAITVLAPVGTAIWSVVSKVVDFVGKLRESTVESESFRKKVADAFQKLKDFVQPAIDAVAKFVGEKIAEIKKFWDSDGQQFVQAVQNAFQIIQNVIAFVMPFVLALIKSVWGNIKGVINGALNIIMGAIKIFSGLFTGDFKKMWEGVKQLFKGAIEFVWNLINLLFIGKIAKGIGSFIKGIGTTLKNGWDNAIGGIKGFVGKADGWFKDFVKKGKDKFDDLVKGAKELPGKIGDGIKNMAGKATDGVKSLGNKMVGILENVINSVTQSGINSVLNKLGVDKKHQIPKMDIPEFKNGTKGSGHKGGLAILGDGGQRELYMTPDGRMGLSPNTDTLMNLPKGTQVLSGKNTMKALGNIPTFKNGTGWLNNAWNGIKSGASKAKDWAFDVWEYASNPSKLMSKVWETLGLPNIDISGTLGQIAKGSVSMVKDKAVGFVKGLIPDFGGGSSVGAPSGKGVNRWRSVILQAATAMKESITGAELNGILAQIQRESGGNQSIIQSSAVWDVNTASGNPARGLLQYIPQTFNAYKVPGHNNIYSGYDQLLAFFNNRTWRRDLPYGRRGWGPRGGRKYEEGGIIKKEHMALVGEGNKEEVVIPLEQHRPRALSLLGYAAQKLGVINSKPTTPIRNTSTSSRNTSNNNSTSNNPYTVVINPAPVYLDGYEVTKIIFNHIDDMRNQRWAGKMAMNGVKY